MEARSDGTLRLSLAFGSNWRADAKYDGDLARFHYRWDWEGEGSNGGQLNACAVAGNPAAKDILSRPLVKRRREANFLWAEWLVQCDREHARCVVEADVMPGRLLFLGSNDSEECAFRLVDSAPGEKLQYAALSYCWGGDQPYMTTKENRQAYYQESGIPHDALAPFKTITDAIYVARLLNLSYLWIDSLCIVQDDNEDKGREIGKMQDIYAGAYVTISAACAATCRDGFLDSMFDDDDTSQDDFEMDYPCIDGTVGAVFLTKDQMISHRDPQPIDARAWTFQEYFLSPRVLVFERRKVRWSCFTAVHEDGGHDNDSGFRLLNSGKLAQLSADELDQEWTWAVERFAQRYLTVQSDKLPAMAGVAARFSPRFGGSRYCAGIWEARLAQQLAWDVSWGNVRSTRPSYRLRDAAPTWSWASIDGLIMFAGHNGGGVEVRRLEFEDYERTLVSDDAPFGAVSAATLVVRARVRRVARASAYSIRPDANLRGFSGYHATIRGDVRDEVESIQEEKKELRCLETSTYVWTNARKETYLLSKGLLVVPAGKKSFKRLGTFEISCPIETCREGGSANPDLGLESECQTSERQQDEQRWIDRYWFVDCKLHVIELV
ncbi:Het domain-containing protein [Lasiodiplodia theobromae]|uniref:Het domain-containing protein n=1 Tax=Lasiodiplodia theobromae TaxID=45133 RepID=UPI0015C319A7|nr:Het domain-containing protein [Lasiodiplodia theobromae]KAF4534073.1 Het domain-containing protein [Lasiodiplodia theobromae]